MAYRKPTNNEIKFGYRMLMYMKANLNNTYLLLAVISWIRNESGSNWIGWNPLNIRPGADAKYRIGIRKGRVGYFSVYGSLDAGARASAQLITGLNYYNQMEAAAKRDPGKDYDVNKDGKIDAGSADQKQAIDFLWALVTSKWSAGHYGLKGAQLLDPFYITKTTLYEVWVGLSGTTGWKMPEDTVKDPYKPPPAPNQPRSLKHVLPERDYIEPYAAFTWYESRSKASGGVMDPASTADGIGYNG